MIELLDFFNQNAGGFQAIFSIFLFIATLAYVIINSLMHSEMVKTRVKAETPEVCLGLKKVCSGFYNLAIENISNTPAYDLIFLKAPMFNLAGGINSTDIGFIKNGIKYLPPNQTYESYFLPYRELEDQNQTIEFEFKYRNKNGKKFHQTIVINLSLFYNRMDFGKSIEEQIIEELKGIKESINSLVEKNENK